MNDEPKEKQKSISIWWSLGFAAFLSFVLVFIVINIIPQTEYVNVSIGGVVSDVSWDYSYARVDFQDGRYIYFHGSPNAACDMWVFSLIESNTTYTFFYHEEEVYGEGNEVHYFTGNVLNKILHAGDQGTPERQKP